MRSKNLCTHFSGFLVSLELDDVGTVRNEVKVKRVWVKKILIP